MQKVSKKSQNESYCRGILRTCKHSQMYKEVEETKKKITGIEKKWQEDRGCQEIRRISCIAVLSTARTSRDSRADAGFLYDRAAVVGAALQDPL